MSSSTSNHNPEIITLDAITEIENLNYISKFELSANIVHHISSRLIFYDVHINNLTIVLDV